MAKSKYLGKSKEIDILISCDSIDINDHVNAFRKYCRALGYMDIAILKAFNEQSRYIKDVLDAQSSREDNI